MRWLVAMALLGGMAGFVGALTVCAVPTGAGLASMVREQGVARQLAPGTFIGDVHVQSWGNPADPLVLLVPGTSAWAETWVELAQPLSARGFRVVAMDLAPFGYSARPGDGAYDRPAQAARILGVLEGLNARDAVLVGHSFGAGATVEAAMRAPEGGLRRLMLFNGALALGEPPSSAAWVSDVPLLREWIVSLTFTNPRFLGPGVRSMVHDPARITEAQIDRYRRPLAVQGTTPEVALWTRELLAPTPSLASDPENYRTFTLPTTLIWGREDEITPLAQGEALAALLPNATLTVLDGVGHLPQIEAPGPLLEAVVSALSAR